MIDQVSAPVKLTHKINHALIAAILLGDNSHGQDIDSNLQQDLDRLATNDFLIFYVCLKCWMGLELKDYPLFI